MEEADSPKEQTAMKNFMVDVDGIKRPLLPPEATLDKLAMELYDWSHPKE